MEIPWERFGLARFSAVYAGEALLFVDGFPDPGEPAGAPLVIYDEEGADPEAYRLRLLASVLNPTLSSHELAAVCTHYGILACQPAEAVGRLFVALIEEAIGLDRRIVAVLARFLPSPLGDLFKRILILPSPPPPEPAAAVADGEPVSVPALVDEVLGPEGYVASEHPGYEFRSGQLEMAGRVASRFADGGALVVEAGPGTGKTFAYLIPAILHLREDGSARVIVSTRTKQLQEQLYMKDLPFLTRGLFPDLKVAILKGRGNYLCLRRWETLVGEMSEGLERDRLVLLAPLVRWLMETETGDIEENRAFLADPRSRELWGRLCDSPHHCLEGFCPHLDECFSVRARRAARRADLVVVNHSLLLADVAAGGLILGEYTDLVVDEAHSLEDAARKAFTSSLSLRLIERFADDLAPRRGQRGWLRRLPLPSERLRSALDAVASLRTAAGDFFTSLASKLPPDQRGRIALALSAEGLDAVERAVLRVELELEGVKEILEEEERRRREVEGHIEAAGELLRIVRELLSGPDEDTVHWFDREGGDLFLNVTPLEVAPILAGSLYPPLRSVILTSATLSLGGDFDFLCRSVGLTAAFPEIETYTVSDPFPYSERMRICVPTFLPSIAEDPEEYARLLADLLARLHRAVERKGLVLFTSYRMLNAVRDRLPPTVPVLAQGIDGPRSGLIERFRKSDGGILLFGTDSFWEGVDLPGEDLELLVITRLPFLVPTDPINAALSERYGKLGQDPFSSLSLPQAILRLRQGVGRLIRTKSDRGVVLITDGRILVKQYGEKFQAALPVPIEPFSDPSRLVDSIGGWFSSASSGPDGERDPIDLPSPPG